MRKNFLRIVVLLAILTLVVAMAAQTVNALTIKNVKNLVLDKQHTNQFCCQRRCGW